MPSVRNQNRSLITGGIGSCLRRNDAVVVAGPMAVPCLSDPGDNGDRPASGWTLMLCTA
jgi:hypothetical protein